MMAAGIALGSVTAFALLGIGLGIFQLNGTVRNGLRRVADVFSIIDDEDDEEDTYPLMDDANFDIDEETEEQFQGIVGGLTPLEELAKKIAREEST